MLLTYVHLACFCVALNVHTVTLLYFVKIGLMLWKYRVACSIRLALATLCVWGWRVCVYTCVMCVHVCVFVCMGVWTTRNCFHEDVS